MGSCTKAFGSFRDGYTSVRLARCWAHLQLAAGRAELKRAADEHTRGQQESKQSLEALHGVCRELRSKCASTLDELEAEILSQLSPAGLASGGGDEDT